MSSSPEDDFSSQSPSLKDALFQTISSSEDMSSKSIPVKYQRYYFSKTVFKFIFDFYLRPKQEAPQNSFLVTRRSFANAVFVRRCS